MKTIYIWYSIVLVCGTIIGRNIIISQMLYLSYCDVFSEILKMWYICFIPHRFIDILCPSYVFFLMPFPKYIPNWITKLRAPIGS